MGRNPSRYKVILKRFVELRKEVTAMRFIFWYAVAAQAAIASEEADPRKDA